MSNPEAPEMSEDFKNRMRLAMIMDEICELLIKKGVMTREEYKQLTTRADNKFEKFKRVERMIGDEIRQIKGKQTTTN